MASKIKKEKIKKEKHQGNSRVAYYPEQFYKDTTKNIRENLSPTAQCVTNTNDYFSNETGFTNSFLKTYIFQEIIGLQFEENGSPIFHIDFASKENSSKIMKKCSRKDLQEISKTLNRDILLIYLKQCLFAIKNNEIIEPQRKRLLSEREEQNI